MRHTDKTSGDDFRTVSSEIGDLLSIVPNSVNILALTATATTESYYTVSEYLSMDNPVLVSTVCHQTVTTVVTMCFQKLTYTHVHV